MRSYTLKKQARISTIVCACLGLLLAGCNSESTDGALDTSRLPRISGGKEISSSAVNTIFTSPLPVPQTADALEKTLGEAGWQRYAAPNSSAASDPNMRMMSLKKNAQAVSVFITVAPAQGNATSVQYAVVPLKTDLPFTKDASNIEYAPDKPLLVLTTAQPVNDVLDFYRKELSARGWSLWSDKLGAKQPSGGASGTVHLHGAYAQYVNDKEPSVVLVLTALGGGAGKSRIELKEWPIETLKTGRATPAAPQIDVTQLPRLPDAALDPAHAAASDVRYGASVQVEEASAAVVKLLAASGWQQYFPPSEEPSATLMFFKKGPQGLSVSLTQKLGDPSRSAIHYSPNWIYVDVPLSEDASDVVFDDRRPYLNYTTTRSADSLLDFYRAELGASGWVPLTQAVASTRWPDAKLDNGSYFIREKQKPVLLSLKPAEGGKTSVEVRVAPFTLPQSLEAGEDIFGLPRPKLANSAGGTGGQTRKEVHALVPAEVGTVLAFYRGALSARNWKEESKDAVVTPEQVTLNFTTPDGTAALEIGRRYDLTNVSLVQTVTKQAASSEPVAAAPPSTKDDPFADMLKQAQQMMHDADAGSKSMAKPQKQAQAPSGAVEKLERLSGKDAVAPIPVPGTASDVEYTAEDGKLEFNASSSVASVAEFYRAAMKQDGWVSRPSVINNPNMAVLEFSKGGKALSITVMRMGERTNVSAEGPALLSAAPKTDAPAAKDASADTASQPATEDDLVVEESGGLPLPKRHTMSVGDKSPFRRALTANVPLNLSDVLGFYRRELGKLNWKEEAGATVAADKADISYASPDGPALLKLGRKDGETTVKLILRMPAEAAKAGIVAKPGQAKLLVTNPNDVEATLTVGGKTVKSPANSGTKGPDGVMLDVAPGKHKVSVKLSGQGAHEDDIEVGANETWGILIGPGGILPVQVY